MLDLQQRTRMMLMKYQIRPGSFSVMARAARKAISNTEELSELFELFINLQEFASIAKQRKVLDEAAMTQSGEQSTSGAAATTRRRSGDKSTVEEKKPPQVQPKAPPTKAEKKTEDRGAVEIDEKTSADFFNNLDR
ncbi:hypothetical protein [Nisaea sp.]|uniref:hypothetical protein n=1 Tax=Nisaea sp. TaxID=2024842 RepID=UPI003B52D7FF